MFESNVYVNRRRALLSQMASRTSDSSRGIAVFLGNVDAPTNYRGNDYKFRQDSNFLYYWGIDEPWFAAVLDLNSGEECLYGNDVDIDDIISVMDVTYIQRYIANLTTFTDRQMYLADSDGDGILSVFDATHIQMKLAGLLKDSVEFEDSDDFEEI